MNTKRLSDQALAVIDQYSHFRVGNATVAIPYYNNKRSNVRGAFRALVGKGSPQDIFEEIEILCLKEKISPSAFSDETLKKFLVESNIGIDCSGFAYYVLNAESIARGKHSIDRHLAFPLRRGIFAKIKSKMRPAENAGAATFAHNKNSHTISIQDAMPGDIVTMVGVDGNSRDHILVIHQIEYQNFVPTVLHYTNSIAWPEDGLYNHGVREGTITILDPQKSIVEQLWTEAGKSGDQNPTFARAQKINTELRRMKWF